MKVITQDDIAKEVPNNYYLQYKYSIFWSKTRLADGRFASDIYAELVQFDTITAKNVRDIIGQEGWCLVLCSECNENVFRAIQFNNETIICMRCIDLASHL